MRVNKKRLCTTPYKRHKALSARYSRKLGLRPRELRQLKELGIEVNVNGQGQGFSVIGSGRGGIVV